MSSLEGRFTAHFSPDERQRLRELAADEASSENYYVRLGLRIVLGLPVPPRIRREVLERLEGEQLVA